MLKPALTLGLLALGVMAVSGVAQAASPSSLSGQRIATGSYAPLAGTCLPGKPCQPNRQFQTYRTPVPGQSVMLNPQPLPPKELFLRR